MSGFISPTSFMTAPSPASTRLTKDDGSLTKSKTAPQTAEEKFLAYAKMTPAEKIRDALLKSVGVTEDDLKNMSPKEREAIENKIKEKIKQAAESQADKKPGFITDISA
ncbi:MAG TPA: hypothetical protein VGC77_06355 [Rhodopseudomonas sp.]|uniref:hypothetical protein n=1 Tax=Rhodopseudomonas sp. TaxID=1078 RepID=UPI002ED7AB09